jgi:hypothetical protein
MVTPDVESVVWSQAAFAAAIAPSITTAAMQMRWAARQRERNIREGVASPSRVGIANFPIIAGMATAIAWLTGPP